MFDFIPKWAKEWNKAHPFAKADANRIATSAVLVMGSVVAAAMILSRSGPDREHPDRSERDRHAGDPLAKQT